MEWRSPEEPRMAAKVKVLQGGGKQQMHARMKKCKEGAENREHVTRSSSRKLQRVNVKTVLINTRYGEFQLISPDCV